MRKYVKTSPIVERNQLPTQALRQYLDELAIAITDLQDQVTAIQSDIASLQSDVSSLDTRVTALEP